ncbi:MAG TPA: hydroxymethylbilane synthase [Methanocorpusculum sp.]|nr:hydroxymethylbilane synthase [Methanocorpusculum sp.]HJJ40375.1 hydroxymethylbilane synthase [Methanocorpusculum sp.]HJJ49670.1 hydroxymethylbilane synthase [Methanocorpusculum sp.]HJJ57608.1 hydroxymethylbilane synthase [Methanocorpusculum sp.]
MIRIGTRGSKLALAQTKKVIVSLAERGIEAEQVIITTKGDKVTDCGLHKIGSYGVFVRELDNAILSGEIDAAVHSMKDIPAERPEGLRTVAVLPRDSPNDFLVTKKTREDIHVIGTSSLRRKAQIRRNFGDTVVVKDLRGNIDTRLAKLESGEFDAIVLAEAGLQRLNISVPGFRLPVDDFIPSPNQGTIAVVSRDTPELRALLSPLNDAVSERDTESERAVMEELGGGCFTPQGVYCHGGKLIAEVLSLDGTRVERLSSDNMSAESARALGRDLRKRALPLIQEAKSVLEVMK